LNHAILIHHVAASEFSTRSALGSAILINVQTYEAKNEFNILYLYSYGSSFSSSNDKTEFLNASYAQSKSIDLLVHWISVDNASFQLVT
jgi:hypothetical protein